MLLDLALPGRSRTSLGPRWDPARELLVRVTEDRAYQDRTRNVQGPHGGHIHRKTLFLTNPKAIPRFVAQPPLEGPPGDPPRGNPSRRPLPWPPAWGSTPWATQQGSPQPPVALGESPGVQFWGSPLWSPWEIPPGDPRGNPQETTQDMPQETTQEHPQGTPLGGSPGDPPRYLLRVIPKVKTCNFYFCS